VAESQTRRRISEEQQSPDGEPWQAWSANYAATRHGGQSLLQGEGDLVDSITSEIEGDEALIGSNLIYAAIHQHGGTPDMAPGPAGIPAREYLGFSQDNLDEIETVADRWLDKHLEAA
jgi:phage virion morphogenesis protein